MDAAEQKVVDEEQNEKIHTESDNITTEKSTKAEEVAGDEFEYLQRNEFTSEIFKIEVRNLGYFGIGVSASSTKVYLQI